MEDLDGAFNAGFDEGFDKGCVFNYHEAKSLGIEEVVEWINTFPYSHSHSVGLCKRIPYDILKAKLKEWGIEKW